MERARILIVDDEAVIRDGLKRVLEGESFVVETCSSGYSAIEIMQRREFDLIYNRSENAGNEWNRSTEERPDTSA